MTRDHWNKHATQWSHVGTPLRPSLEDITRVESFLLHTLKLHEKTNALLLGVTPELATMQWPNSTNLLAIDRSQAMIDNVWPKQHLPTKADAIFGNWLATPCDNNSQDIVIGDGCFTLLSYGNQYRSLLEEVHRIVKRNGWFVIRHFVRPSETEHIDTVFADLLAGNIGNFHIFKWRLAMALHGTIEEGVVVGEIWDAFHKKNININNLSARLGWKIETINTINNYKHVDTRYSFPTLNEIRDLTNHYFTEYDQYFPSYELGDRCPTFFLKPRE